jgi:hypothetical protein
LVRLFHASWSSRRDSRFERDVRSCVAGPGYGRS